MTNDELKQQPSLTLIRNSSFLIRHSLQFFHQHARIHDRLPSPGIVHENQYPLTLLFQASDLRNRGNKLRAAVQVIVLGGTVPFEPPGLVPSLEANVRRLGRRAEKGLLFQARSTVDAGKCDMRRSQMFRRLAGIPGSTAKLSYQRNAFKRIPQAAEPFEVVSNEIEPGRKLREDSRQLSGFF